MRRCARAHPESCRMISPHCSQVQVRERTQSHAGQRSNPMARPGPAAARPFGWPHSVKVSPRLNPGLSDGACIAPYRETFCSSHLLTDKDMKSLQNSSGGSLEHISSLSTPFPMQGWSQLVASGKPLVPGSSRYPRDRRDISGCWHADGFQLLVHRPQRSDQVILEKLIQNHRPSAPPTDSYESAGAPGGEASRR